MVCSLHEEVQNPRCVRWRNEARSKVSIIFLCGWLFDYPFRVENCYSEVIFVAYACNTLHYFQTETSYLSGSTTLSYHFSLETRVSYSITLGFGLRLPHENGNYKQYISGGEILRLRTYQHGHYKLRSQSKYWAWKCGRIYQFQIAPKSGDSERRVSDHTRQHWLEIDTLFYDSEMRADSMSSSSLRIYIKLEIFEFSVISNVSITMATSSYLIMMRLFVLWKHMYNILICSDY